MIAIINLLTNILITGTSIIGCATILNKVGRFCKIIEENDNDGFKKGFDNFMIESIDEMNKCVESVSTIVININNIFFIVYDILIGNKFIKKNKEGKLIICGKSKFYSGYKDKINELNSKVKKYQDELKKIKKPNNKTQNTEESSISDDKTIISEDLSSESENEIEKNNSESSDFTLESDSDSESNLSVNNDIKKNKK
jgi:hypothetical protein